MSTAMALSVTYSEVRGDRVAALIWEQKLNLKVLADRCDMHNTTLSQKLHGRRRWYLTEVARMAEVLDTTVAYLIGEDDDPKPGPPNSDAIEWAEFQLWRARRDSNSQPSDP